MIENVHFRRNILKFHLYEIVYNARIIIILEYFSIMEENEEDIVKTKSHIVIII